jgi:hypothetical protein
VWEWLLVEALIRQMADEQGIWGVPGTLVAKRALSQHGYLDARSYLKTPRIFGFHGVYKRLAIHLGLVNVHLGPGPNAERLVDAWARGLGHANLEAARPLLSKWTAAVRRSLAEDPPRTRPNWGSDSWQELAEAFAPSAAKAKEKRWLEQALHGLDERSLGALPAIWRLQPTFSDAEFREESLHDRLEKQHPQYKPLLGAIRAYEQFARSLQDAFDLLKAEASRVDGQGFEVPRIARDKEFTSSVKGLHLKFEVAHRALGDTGIVDILPQNLFAKRFDTFAEPMDAGACALALCAHHESVQRAKSAAGKRSWFDRMGPQRIFIRHAFREPRREIRPGDYVHEYRGLPIRRFRADLS